jgi:hypothetical protein
VLASEEAGGRDRHDRRKEASERNQAYSLRTELASNQSTRSGSSETKRQCGGKEVE